VRYPTVKVKLIGEDGNAFAIIGRVSRCLKAAGADPVDVKAFTSRCMQQPSYDHLLNFVQDWVVVR
jgi:hypothetical protein